MMNIIPKWWIQRGQCHRSKVQAPQRREARQSFWVWPEGAPFWGSQWKRSQDCWETRLPSQVPGRAGMRTRDGICLSFSSHFSNPDRLPSSLGPGVQPGPSTGALSPLSTVGARVPMALVSLCCIYLHSSGEREQFPDEECVGEKFLRNCMSDKVSILSLGTSTNLAIHRFLGCK